MHEGKFLPFPAEKKKNEAYNNPVVANLHTEKWFAP